MASEKWIRPPVPQKLTTEGGKYYFDVEAAEHAVQFFEKWLVHTAGEWAGKPFKLLAWQREEIIKPLFGWKVTKTGCRRFKRVYVEIPKKNGKSALASGLSLYLTGADNEPGAEVFAAATCEEQARLVFDEAKNIVKASKILSAFYKFTKSQISVPLFNSTFRVLSKAAETKHGLRPHGVIIDELHAHKRPDLYRVLTEGAGDARRQPVTFIITTSGTSKTTIGWEEHEHAVNVLNGDANDPELLVVIYAADPKDDWKSPATWRKANPSIGVTIKEETVQRACERAIERPSLRDTFKQLRLNIWSSVSSRWLTSAEWDKCRAIVNEDDLKGRPCWGGMDLSSTKDIAALVWFFEFNDKFLILPRFFVPMDNVDAREKSDAVNYRRWIKDGHIIATDGNRIDYEAIRRQIAEDAKVFDIRCIGYDSWNASETVGELEKSGLKMVAVPQAFKLTDAAKQFEKSVAKAELIHPGNPALDWMAENVEVITSAQDNIRLVKPQSATAQTKRIDGIVAAVMARERYTRRDDSEPKRSKYESEGLTVV